MFETLMKSGSLRVDYFDAQSVGTPGAFAFYVCGELPPEAAYSQSGKKHLLAGLATIHDELRPENMVGIYLDVNALNNPQRPGYIRLKQDISTGMFRRVFVACSCQLLNGQAMLEDLGNFYQEVGGFEVFTFAGGACRQLFPGTFTNTSVLRCNRMIR